MWIIYPRNFGNSDYTSGFDADLMANDVLRFMYYNKISTATIGGHGLGASIALKTATREYSRFTGFFGLDYTPVDYESYDVVKELKQTVTNISKINLTKPRAAILGDINKSTEVGFLYTGPEIPVPFPTELGQVGHRRLHLELQHEGPPRELPAGARNTQRRRLPR